MASVPMRLPPSLPDRRERPYTRPVPEPVRKRAKAVTIAVGLQYGPGAILGADRLVSHGDASYAQAFSHYERKIDGFLTSEKSSVVMVGAGDFPMLRSAFENVSRLLNPEPAREEDRPTLRDALEAELDKMFSKPLASSSMGLDMLVAETEFEQTTRLLKCSGPIVTDAAPFECVGVGDTSLIRYLADGVFHQLDASRESAMVLAIYMIQMAKRYIPQYCGGETDVWDVSGGFWREIPASRIQMIEQLLGSAPLYTLKPFLEKLASSLPTEP
jgi:hypothetical protein